VFTSFSARAGHPSRLSEDWAGASPTVAVVLDGLSTPTGHETGCGHGTPWFVDQLGPCLLDHASSPQRTLADSLARAITEVAALHPECDLDSTATPSAAVAAARVLPSAERVEYLVLADTTVLLGRADKSEPDAISDRRVDRFAQAEVEAALRAPIGSDEHRDALTELVAAQRRLRNTPAGYWVAGADPRAAEQALTGTAALADVTDLALLTDGTSCIVTVFGELTDQQVLELLRHDGPETLINQVRAIELADPRGVRWPRFKTSDDATALYLRW